MVNSKDEQALLRSLGKRLRKRREALGLSRQAVAEAAGLNYDYLGSVERGERNVAIINLARLAEVLECSDVGELLDGVSL